MGIDRSGWLSFAEGLAGGVAAVIIIIAPVARWMWRRFVRSLAGAVAELLERSERIERQVTPNGGDDPAKLATRVLMLEDRMKDLGTLRQE